jgi:hypothetical protein
VRGERERERESIAGMAAERDIDDLPRGGANYTALTPLWFLERAAVAHPDRAAVVHGPVRYTWAETYRRCRRLASALAQRSVGPGCTVNFFPLSFFFLPATSPVSAVKFYPFFYIKKSISDVRRPSYIWKRTR